MREIKRDREKEKGQNREIEKDRDRHRKRQISGGEGSDEWALKYLLLTKEEIG